jgi:putative FmdB family regulatory protein
VPTYQYACTECGHQLEAVQSFSDAALTECPTCHGKLRKVFNSVGIVFKGSGFYRNDSRSGNGAEKAEKNAGADKAESPAAKKTESSSSSDSTSTSTTPSSTPASSSSSGSSASSSSSSRSSSGSSSSSSTKAAAAS